MMNTRRLNRLGLSAGLALLAGGCASKDAPRPLTADTFLSSHNTDDGGVARVSPVDRPGEILYDNVVKVPLIPQDQQEAPDEVHGVAPTVRRTLTSPGETRPPTSPAAARPVVTTQQSAQLTGAEPPTPADRSAVNAARAAQRPATLPVDPSGQYQSLGSVLAVVNGQPIYAHKVLAELETPLAAEAKRYDSRAFRPVAQQFVGDKIRQLVRDELVFAAAQKALSEKEKALAEFLTSQWRERQITLAGGAVEMAKRKSAEEGIDFEERVHDRYREYMAQLYFTKKVVPRIQVSAGDIRNYYEANRDKEFTQSGAIKFRLIKIDPTRFPGGLIQAKDKAETLRKQAQSGDFAHLAAANNLDDKNLARNEGLVGSKEQEWWVERGAYALESVEQAVWKLQPGQVSDVIQDRGGLYIAKLEAKRDAVMQGFDDAKVQEKISETLRNQQFRVLHDKAVQELLKAAILQENPQMIEIATDMAIQRYPHWASAQ